MRWWRGLNGLAAELCRRAGCETADICEAVVCGNTAMHHLLLGLPVGQLVRAPYVPALTGPVDVKARELALSFAAGAYVHLMPCVAGYVGGDHVGVILATRLGEHRGVALAVDVGTNTEIALVRE
ncbi:MAG: ferredoxin, partial [Bacillota bacterium]